jgi:hypothetical protein
MFATVLLMLFEVEVVIPMPLDDPTRRFLDAVQRSANRLVGFSGDSSSTKLLVEVTVMCREDAIRAATGEVARIFPNRGDQSYGQPRQV